MTRRSVEIHPDALEEAEAATAWYAQRSPRAARAFLAELDAAIVRISEHQEQFPAFESGTRRLLLRKFPYYVVFRETTPTLQIIA